MAYGYMWLLALNIVSHKINKAYVALGCPRLSSHRMVPRGADSLHLRWHELLELIHLIIIHTRVSGATLLRLTVDSP